MAQILLVIKTVLSLFPLIIQAVTTVEGLFPASGAGAQKLDAVKAVIQGAYSTATSVETSFESVWPAIQSVIASVVTSFNSLNLFSTAKTS